MSNPKEKELAEIEDIASKLSNEKIDIIVGETKKILFKWGPIALILHFVCGALLTGNLEDNVRTNYTIGWMLYSISLIVYLLMCYIYLIRQLMLFFNNEFIIYSRILNAEEINKVRKRRFIIVVKGALLIIGLVSIIIVITFIFINP